MEEAIAHITIIYIIWILLSILMYKGLTTILRKKLARIILLFFLISPTFMYFPTEIKTMLYGQQFEQVSIYTGFNSPIIYYKVFDINKHEAKLFIVEGEDGVHSMGSFYWFEKRNMEWIFNGKWYTIWTYGGGNASEFTIPPYF